MERRMMYSDKWDGPVGMTLGLASPSTHHSASDPGPSAAFEVNDLHAFDA